MSTQVTTAFAQQFSANVTLLSQQMGSRLRGAIREESLTGEKGFFDQVGSVAAVKRTSRHGDTPLVETPHSRRMVTMVTYEWADLIDDADRVQMLIDPTSTYAQAAASAIGRAMDDEIITAATCTSLTCKTGSTSTSISNSIAHGSADLTVAKILQAKELLDEGDVDPSINRYFAVAPDQITALLNTTEVKSSDYNTVKALAQGQLDSFCGFKFIVSNRLSVASSIRECFAWAEDGILLAMGKDTMARIEERADKSYSTQVYYCASFAATRMEESKVVRVYADESA